MGIQYFQTYLQAILLTGCSYKSVVSGLKTAIFMMQASERNNRYRKSTKPHSNSFPLPTSPIEKKSFNI